MPNLNIEISEELRRAMAHYCIDNGCKQSEFVIQTLEAALTPSHLAPGEPDMERERRG